MKTLALAFAATLLLIGCASTDRYVETEAFERCRSLSGEARSRCIDQERDRVSGELAARDDEIMREIQAENEHGAMRRGEQAGRPSAAGGQPAPDHPRQVGN